ncbi:hypothetical protein JYU20_00880, partial [Bacteroidales bacterium AH-315-I05]|nr:hypothetical protein [Bacteroidales bacterium AH-315-I05]
MNQRVRTYQLLLVLAALTAMQQLYGAVEVTNAHYVGDADIYVGNVLTIEDDKYPFMVANSLWPQDFTNHRITNRIILGIDETSDIFSSISYTVEVELEIRYFPENQLATPVSLPNQTLTVTYNPARGTSYQDRDIFVFTGGHKVEITVVSVENGSGTSINPTDNIFIDLEVNAERYYAFDPMFVPDPNGFVFTQKSSTELEVSMDFIDGAEEYDLEWTFINSYTGTLQEYNFTHNATRVKTTETSYIVPMVYEQGKLLFRVRGVGRGGVNFDKPIEGKWSTDSYGEIGPVSNAPSATVFTTISGGHLSDDLNWKYSATYIEEGKRNTTVSYFDGSLRSRQSVSKLNTEDKTIASSVLYDHQGRPAIQVLPTPLTATNLRYNKNLNISLITNQSYDRLDFDIEDLSSSAACSSVLSGMASFDIDGLVTGAANYYSPDNPDQEGAQAFLPDAQGFPFMQVEYTPDLTGRISRQGGVGPDHQLGGNLEIRYHYGQPEQEELDMLFGSEVGFASHYKKNIMVDPNGQISTSYIDLHDRVVATSLAGPTPTSPANLEELLSNNAPVIMTSDLTQHTNTETNAYNVNHPIMVTSPGTYKFTYDFTTETFQDACIPSNICFDCIYEVEMSIKNECGEEMLPDVTGDGLGDPINELVGNVNPFDITCDGPVTFSLTPSPLQIDFTEVGNYQLHKTLRVSDLPIEFYSEQYIENNTCSLTFQDFLDQEMAAIDFSGCNIDPCEHQCLLELGTLQQFLDGGGSQTDYEALFDACQNDCNTAINDPCEQAKLMLLADLMPSGQYAKYEFTGGTISTTDLFSIFNFASRLTTHSSASGAANPPWEHPITPYKDPDGIPAMVLFNGVLTLPEDLPVLEFITNFKPSWAESLLEYHPEYCYYQFCIDNQASFDYMEDMVNTQSYDEACDKGFLNPLGETGFPIPGTVLNNCVNYNCTTTTTSDPYFCTGPGTDPPDQISQIIDFVNTYNSSDFSVWQLVSFLVHCSDAVTTSFPASANDITTCASNNLFGTNDCTKDIEWQTFRALYLGKRLQLMENKRNEFAVESACYN